MHPTSFFVVVRLLQLQSMVDKRILTGVFTIIESSLPLEVNSSDGQRSATYLPAATREDPRPEST